MKSAVDALADIARFKAGDLVRGHFPDSRDHGRRGVVKYVFMGQIAVRPLDELDVVWMCGPADVRHVWEPG